MASGVTSSSESIWSLNQIFYFKRQNLNKTMKFWIWAVQCTPFCLNLIHFCLCKFVVIFVICERSFNNSISSLIHITVCLEGLWTPRFLEWVRHHFSGRDGLWESPPLSNFVQFYSPPLRFFQKNWIYLRNHPKLPNAWYNYIRGCGIGQNLT